MVFREHRQFLLCCRLQPGSRLLTGCTDGVVKVLRKLWSHGRDQWIMFWSFLTSRFGMWDVRLVWAQSRQGNLLYRSTFIQRRPYLQVLNKTKHSWSFLSQPGLLASRYQCIAWERDPGAQDWKTGLDQMLCYEIFWRFAQMETPLLRNLNQIRYHEGLLGQRLGIIVS